MERPTKRTKLLDDSDSDGVDTRRSGGKANGGPAALSINKDFARRFEHNKQREERQRLEERFRDDDEDDGSSTDESEDDEADLITDDLDNEIMTTLAAIRAKDPRVYNKDVKFYREFDTSGQAVGREKKEAPMTLKDYHRENLLAGYTGADEEEVAPQTYAQEQESLRRDVIKQMHAAGTASDNESDDGFQLKAKGTHEDIAPARTKQKRKMTSADVDKADEDAETFLSNFMASQAWRAGDSAHPHAFNSDDSEDEARADAFEEAYNMRFEDPATANETLKSFARDAGTYSVRREEAGGRKRAREREKQAKADAKQEREEDRARLRKLKIDDAEKKLKAIKQAAGLRGKVVSLEQWRDLLDGDFSDDAWDKEMDSRFGAEYYDEESADSKPGKPTWDDDIDIRDIVPDFDDSRPAAFELSDNDSIAEAQPDSTKIKSKKERERAKREEKSQHRRELREIEGLVDASLPVAAAQSGSFRYRETSPHSFGLSARDILFASDAQLNEFAGLKKLATFRDEERKSRDRRKLGKKARLREWRKEVFGNADGVEGRSFDDNADDAPEVLAQQTDGAQPSKKRKRSRKGKSSKVDA